MNRMQKLWIAALFGLGLSFAMAGSASAVVDNTTCKVLSNSDSVDDFNSLRRKVEEGFNRKQDFRMCTDLIRFESGGEMTILLTKPLHFNNDQDLDCQGDSPACKDGIAMLLDGTPNGGKVVIDTTGLADDKCAIEITASRFTARGFTVKTKQSNLVTAMKQSESGVICDNGNNNDFSGVEIETVGSGSEVCGNGNKEGNEECDDGNTVSGDGCSSACTAEPDADGDGIPDDVDNCKNDANADQKDCDTDGKGDVCDNDWDNDDKPDGVDNCAPDQTSCQDAATLANLSNPDQSDKDGDGMGDVCDDDIDGDGRPNASDNCPLVANPDQEDKDGDGLGAACDPSDEPTDNDTDGDGVPDSSDNCPTDDNGPLEGPNDQLDTDSDGNGDVCDVDDDNDGLSDADETVQGLDPLDPDFDDDGVIDGVDSCPKNPDPSCGTPEPTDDPVDNDVDGDGVANTNDNCPNSSNAGQEDGDGDGIGDACDLDNPEADSDGDGVKNGEDNCPSVGNNDQVDTDEDKLGDACDPAPQEPAGQAVTKSGGGCFNSVAGATGLYGDAWLLALGALAGIRALRRK